MPARKDNAFDLQFFLDEFQRLYNKGEMRFLGDGSERVETFVRVPYSRAPYHRALSAHEMNAFKSGMADMGFQNATLWLVHTTTGCFPKAKAGKGVYRVLFDYRFCL